MNLTLKHILVALSFTTLYGCGGDSGSGPIPVADSYVFPAGKATITFSAISTARLTAPISGIDFTVTLPQGMSVTTTSGASGQIDSAIITAGSALAGTNLAFGSYSVATRKAHLTMGTTSNNYRSGEFLRLVCTVASSPAITLGDLRTLNNPVSVIKAVGYNQATQSTVVLTGKLNVAIGAAP